MVVVEPQIEETFRCKFRSDYLWLASSSGAGSPLALGSDDPKLTSLHGTMVIMLDEEYGMPMEVWAEGNRSRGEIRTPESKVITIQHGPNSYVYGEGSKKGVKETIHGGLGTLGLIKQIEEIKQRGEKKVLRR